MSVAVGGRGDDGQATADPEPGAERRGGGSPRFLYLLVFVCGIGSLGAEIAAVRLVAPYFGASTIVWANTIGIVLIALSIGYWLGGRFADRHPEQRRLCLVALLAAALIAAVPFIAQPLLDAGVSALDDVSVGTFIGSLVAVLLLVAIPVLLLGSVSPWAIRLAVDDVGQAGTIAGRLYALSTAGSLLGTLMSALVLIPLIGTRRTFLLLAFMIAAVAVAGIGRRRARYAAAPALIALLAIPPPGDLTTEPGERLLHETETAYQYARVLERDDGSRALELNEGHAVHSLYHPDTVLTDDVWDQHLVLPFTGLDRPPRRIAMLGNAAGTVARAYEELFPETYVDGVEIDGELSRIGRRWFDMNNPRLQTFDEDARPFLRRIDRRYDVISADAYRQPYIPFYLATREFFELVRARLTPDGLLILNAAHPPGEDELERSLSATIGAVFPHVLRDPVTSTNTMVVASMAPIGAGRLRSQVASLPLELRPGALATARRLEPPLGGGEVFTDDKAPVEWLIDGSFVDYADGG